MSHSELPQVLTYATSSSSAFRLRRRFDHVLVGLWIAAAAFFLIATARELIFHVSSTAWTTMWESAPLQVAMNASRGEPIYGNWHDGPVHLAIYGPLYYGTLATLAKAAQGNPDTLTAMGRWWGVFSLGAGLVAVAWFIRSRTGMWWAAVIGTGCVALVTPTALRFVASARPDAMAAALSCLGLAAALTGRRGGLLPGALLLSLAWLTKVTAVSAALTVVAVLVWQRSWRRLAWFLGTYCAVNGLAVGALMIATDGWFLRHMQVASTAPSHPAYAWYMLIRRPYEPELLYLFVFPLLGLLIVFLVTSQRLHEQGAADRTADTGDRAGQPATGGGVLPSGSSPDRLSGAPAPLQIAALFFGLSTAVALATAFRQGSDRNYLIEPALAAGMVMGTWAVRVAPWRQARAWLWTRAVACAVLLSPMLLNLPDRLANFDATDRLQRDVLSPYQDEALAWARTLPQPLLCLDSWLAYRAGVPNDVNDPIAYSSHVLAGGQDPIADRVRNGFYACIVTTAPLAAGRSMLYGDIATDWSSLRDAVQGRYQHSPSPGWNAYTPINRAAASRPETSP